MKELNFKTGTWHYWLANFPERRIYASVGSDICAYTRAVLSGLLFVTLMTLTIGYLLSLFAYMILYSIGNVIGWLFFGYILESTSVGVLSIVFGFVLFVFALAYYMDKRDEIFERLEKSEPGFIRTAYRSWKDKYCARVKFD